MTTIDLRDAFYPAKMKIYINETIPHSTHPPTPGIHHSTFYDFDDS